MGLFSRLPVQQIIVASVLGVFSGMYIFAPGIIEFSSQIRLNRHVDESELNKTPDGGSQVVDVLPPESKVEN